MYYFQFLNKTFNKTIRLQKVYFSASLSAFFFSQKERVNIHAKITIVNNVC